MIARSLQKTLSAKLFKGKAILLTGPRQVGKTTLIRQILKESGKSWQFFNGDDPSVRQLLDHPNTEELRQILGPHPIIFIDEAQRIPGIGLTAKIITDQISEKQLILSGSSAFELGGHMQEPLTGRKWTYDLLPVSWEEWQHHIGYLKAEQDLENRLVYGFYPDVLNNPDNQQEILTELVDSYLYKDILAYSGIRKPDVIQKLVQALAWQVGQEVNFKEVGDLVGLDPKTVDSYVEILEKAFVVFRLSAFSRNLRNEISKYRKIYFYDTGVRNAVIRAFKPVALRQDTGVLWENFLIAERRKQIRYAKKDVQCYFWRTKQQQEVDYVEVDEDSIRGFEFKWNPLRQIRFPKTFTDTYKAQMKGITRENFREFVM
ncbi:MAG: ATP-binding protein [Cyclonatronaceae bacterium]